MAFALNTGPQQVMIKMNDPLQVTAGPAEMTGSQYIPGRGRAGRNGGALLELHCPRGIGVRSCRQQAQQKNKLGEDVYIESHPRIVSEWGRTSICH